MEPGVTDAKPERPGEPPPEAERTIRMDGRLSGRGRPEDVTRAKREIAEAFDLADEFAQKTAAGSPMWDYMEAQWPYGYPDRALPDIFHRGLTLAFVPPSWKKKAYCPIWTTLKRLGFHPDDEEHVYGTLEVAFFAILALELRTSGGRCLSKDIKFVKDQHRIAFKEIISLNPVIRQWMEPGERWFERLRETMLRNARTRIEVVGAQIQLARDNDSTAVGQMHMTLEERRRLGMERLRLWAEAQHTSMVGYGVQAVLQQLWGKAEATWLSRARQYLGSDRSQWKELRMRCDDERHGYWLATYDQAMLQPPDVIVDGAKTYLRRYLERRAASLSQGRADSGSAKQSQA